MLRHHGNEPSRNSLPADSEQAMQPHDVAARAYTIWQNKGRPRDTALEDWLQAEAELDRAGQLQLLAEQLPAIAWSTDAQLCFTSSMGRGMSIVGVQTEQVL